MGRWVVWVTLGLVMELIMTEESIITYENTPIQDEKDLADCVRGLFTFAFTLNCHLDDSSVTQEEKSTLDALEITEVFENMKDLVVELLRFKQKFKDTSMEELAARSDQFETIIQKLEAKVRTHIGIEQQLKLHIENAQSQYEELENINSQLKKDSGLLSSEKRMFEKNENEIKTLKEKMVDMEKEEKRREGEFSKICNENTRLKKMLEEKSRQVHVLRRENKPREDYMESNEYVKKQVDGLNSEIAKMQQRLKKDVYGWCLNKNIRQKSTKRSISPVSNASQYISPAFKIAQKYIKTHVRSYSEH